MRTLWERPPAAMGRTVNAQTARSPAALSRPQAAPTGELHVSDAGCIFQ